MGRSSGNAAFQIKVNMLVIGMVGHYEPAIPLLVKEIDKKLLDMVTTPCYHYDNIWERYHK